MSDIRYSEAITPVAGFRLDRENAKLMGVCSGLGNYFGVDPTLVRVVFAAGTLFGFGAFILLYLAIGFIAD